MTETTLQIVTSLKIVWLGVYTLLYGLGGVFNKTLRRIWGSFLLVAGIIGFSIWLGTFNYWYMLSFLLLFGATSIGYGDSSGLNKLFIRFNVIDYTIRKILVRLVCGLAYATATLPVFIINNPALFGLQLSLCIAFSVILGVWNPFRSARAEETAIAVSIGLLPLLVV